jgi:hypothetical protein
MLTLAWSLRHSTRRIRIWGGCRKCRATPVHPTRLTAQLGARGECSPRVHSHSYHHYHHHYDDTPAAAADLIAKPITVSN